MALHTALHQHTPTPVVAVNRAVAVGFAAGPRAGLDAIGAAPGLASYVPLHAARADLPRRAADLPAAAHAYELAIAATRNAVQRADLQRRRDALLPVRADDDPASGRPQDTRGPAS